MIKLVAFDWNGTILADTTSQWKAGNAALEHFGHKPISMRQFRATYEIPISKAWLANGGREEEISIQHPIYQAAYNDLERKIRTRAGVRPLLDFLQKKNIKSVIFSNHPSHQIRENLEGLKLKNYFDESLGRDLNNQSHITERGKQERLEHYLRNKHIKPSEIVCIGDTGEEIDISKHLGFYSIALTGGNYSIRRLKALKPDFLIHSPTQAIPIIKKLHDRS